MKYQHNTQLSIFETPKHKGSSEWSAFATVRGDTVGMYRVATPRQPLVVRGARNLLRIISVAPQPYHELREAH